MAVGAAAFALFVFLLLATAAGRRVPWNAIPRQGYVSLSAFVFDRHAHGTYYGDPQASLRLLDSLLRKQETIGPRLYGGLRPFLVLEPAKTCPSSGPSWTASAGPRS